MHWTPFGNDTWDQSGRTLYYRSLYLCAQAPRFYYTDISLTPSCGCELYTPLAVGHLGDSSVPVPPRSLNQQAESCLEKIHQAKPKVFGGCAGQQQQDKAKQGKMSPLPPRPSVGDGSQQGHPADTFEFALRTEKRGVYKYAGRLWKMFEWAKTGSWRSSTESSLKADQQSHCIQNCLCNSLVRHVLGCSQVYIWIMVFLFSC